MGTYHPHCLPFLRSRSTDQAGLSVVQTCLHPSPFLRTQTHTFRHGRYRSCSSNIIVGITHAQSYRAQAQQIITQLFPFPLATTMHIIVVADQLLPTILSLRVFEYGIYI